jgi:hypothetical protein
MPSVSWIHQVTPLQGQTGPVLQKYQQPRQRMIQESPRSLTKIYYIAFQARSKLVLEANRSEQYLRFLVGHANLPVQYQIARRPRLLINL